LATNQSDDRTRRTILADFESLMRHTASMHAPEFLEIEVTMSQAKVLYMVSLWPGINLSAVTARLHVGLSAASGLVDRLVEHGYLERHEDPTDRRQHLLDLSPEGARVIGRVRELNVNHMNRMLVGLTSTELSALRKGVAALDREARALDPTPTASAAIAPERNPA
jgi:DNA-binding MarR family transcriptional regulator